MTRRNKPSTSQVLRPTPLIAVAVVMFLLASTLMAGAQSDGPEITEVGSEGNEKYAVEFKDGYEVNTKCGFLHTTCAGAGAVVIDVDESIVLVNIFGQTVAEVELGVSMALAASAGVATAIPTGSIWLRGWAETIGGGFSEYHRNGYLEAGEVDDTNCFAVVPLTEAVCTDTAWIVQGGGGKCVRALAQAKASNAADHTISQNSKTRVYAAAHTEDTCVAPDAVEDIQVEIDAVLSPEDEGLKENESTESSTGSSDADCWDVDFESFPEAAQQNITDAITNPTKEKLNYAVVSDEAENGDIEENIRLLVVNKLIGGIENAIASQSFPVCAES